MAALGGAFAYAFGQSVALGQAVESANRLLEKSLAEEGDRALLQKVDELIVAFAEQDRLARAHKSAGFAEGSALRGIRVEDAVGWEVVDAAGNITTPMGDAMPARDVALSLLRVAWVAKEGGKWAVQEIKLGRYAKEGRPELFVVGRFDGELAMVDDA